MIDNRTAAEDDIHKDAPGLDPNLEWAEEEYWVEIIKNERLANAFEELATVNRGGTEEVLWNSIK